MKTTVLIVIFFLISNILLGQRHVKLDSVILNDNDEVAIKIYQSEYSKDHKYYRFYNSLGFICFSLEQNEKGEFLRYKNRELKKYYRYDIEKDPVFLSDTFALGFINKLTKMNGISFVDKFNKTSEYYYSIKFCDSISFINSFIENSRLADTVGVEEELIFIVSCGEIEMTEQWYNSFNESILNGVKFSRKEKRDLKNKLIFEIETLLTGKIISISLISAVDNVKKEIIVENIEKLRENNLRPLRSRSMWGRYKAAFYVEL